MRVFFCFSDDAGCYRRDRSERFLRAHPYFIRSAVLMSVEDWAKIKEKFENLLTESHFPHDQELKWSYIGSIVQHRRRGEIIPPDRPYAAFAHLSTEELWDFVYKCLKLLYDAESCVVIYTVTDNKHFATGPVTEENIHAMHIQDLMQRIEMELRPVQGLAIMFSDTMSEERLNRTIRDAYAEIYQKDTFIAEYRCIKDSLAFELSHQSVGIRLADYAAGAFNAFLRGFSPGSGLFRTLIYPKVRKDPCTGSPIGYGIIDVPKRSMVRAKLEKLLREASLLGPKDNEVL